MWNPLHAHDDTDEVEAMIQDSQYVDIPVELIESLSNTPIVPPVTIFGIGILLLKQPTHNH